MLFHSSSTISQRETSISRNVNRTLNGIIKCIFHLLFCKRSEDPASRRVWLRKKRLIRWRRYNRSLFVQPYKIHNGMPFPRSNPRSVACTKMGQVKEGGKERSRTRSYPTDPRIRHDGGFQLISHWPRAPHSLQYADDCRRLVLSTRTNHRQQTRIAAAPRRHCVTESS